MNTYKNFRPLICALSICLVSVAAAAQPAADTAALTSTLSDQVNDQVKTATVSTQQQSPTFSQAELAQMLAPIALYPDSLLTHILIAATYPLEIIQAQRWLSKNEKLSQQQIEQQLNDQSWDASVKALIPFSRILTRMSNDIDWTQDLGDAFLQDEPALLSSIQSLRQKADQAGNLAKMDNVEITRADKNITIEPVQREIVYVPYYDTRYVYGNWHWRRHPPVHWQLSLNNRGFYANHHGPFYWHFGINISFDHFFSAFHWHNRHVVVVHDRTARRHYNRGQLHRSHQAKRWHHNPSHRRGVTYRTKTLSKRYDSHRPYTSKIRVAQRHDGLQVQPINKAKRVNKAKQVNKVRHQQLTKQLAQQKHVIRNQSAKLKAASNHKSTKRHTIKQSKSHQQPIIAKRPKINRKPQVDNKANTKKSSQSSKRSARKPPSINRAYAKTKVHRR
jgi:hypothetical protein